MKEEELVRLALSSEFIKPYGRSGSGCINEGRGYEIDDGYIFVKKNSNELMYVYFYAFQMFSGEYAGLFAMYSTHVIRVPRPIQVIKNPKGGALLVAEYLNFDALKRQQKTLGRNLARLHLYNQELKRAVDERKQWITASRDNDSIEPVSKFGFSETTCCGFLPQDNSWSDNWIEFYFRQRLKPQVDMILEKHSDRELNELLSHLERKITSFFSDLETIEPSLLHGDLWSGNIGETEDEPVIFDPATFYGHSEYDFGISRMFGGLNDDFYDAYFEECNSRPSINFEKRADLYTLFHALNHWNHFGSNYRSTSIKMFKDLIK